MFSEMGNSSCLPFSETKFKGNGDVSWCEMNSVLAGVQEM